MQQTKRATSHLSLIAWAAWLPSPLAKMSSCRSNSDSRPRCAVITACKNGKSCLNCGGELNGAQALRLLKALPAAGPVPEPLHPEIATDRVRDDHFLAQVGRIATVARERNALEGFGRERKALEEREGGTRSRCETNLAARRWGRDTFKSSLGGRSAF